MHVQMRQWRRVEMRCVKGWSRKEEGGIGRTSGMRGVREK